MQGVGWSLPGHGVRRGVCDGRTGALRRLRQDVQFAAREVSQKAGARKGPACGFAGRRGWNENDPHAVQNALGGEQRKSSREAGRTCLRTCVTGSASDSERVQTGALESRDAALHTHGGARTSAQPKMLPSTNQAPAALSKACVLRDRGVAGTTGNVTAEQQEEKKGMEGRGFSRKL